MTSKFRKWGNKELQNSNDPLRIVFFISRNKDNKDIDNFHERREAFLYHWRFIYEIPIAIDDKFNEFVKNGQPGEMCRLYTSVNGRDPQKIKRDLIHRLIDDNLIGQCPLTHMDRVVASIAAKKENRAEKHWMFDFDSTDKSVLSDFMHDITRVAPMWIDYYQTPHGYAIILPHGFDMRGLSDKSKKLIDDGIVTLKRDDMLCAKQATN